MLYKLVHLLYWPADRMYAILATILNGGWAIIVINKEAVEIN